MTSEDLKLREKAPKEVYIHDKTLPKVKAKILLCHKTHLVSFLNNN